MDLDLSAQAHTTTRPVRLGTDRPRWSVSVSPYLFAATVVGSVAATVRALAPAYRDRQRWRFYRHVYDRGGQRDLKAAADALDDHDDDDA
jgi:hypothetical protein